MDAASEPTRRSILQIGAVGAMGAAALSACGSDEPADPAAGSGSVEEGGQSAAGGDDSGASGDNSAAGGTMVPVADVPEGGSLYLADDTLIVAQPSAGEFAAYDATCPHQACAVSGSEGAELVCPCHGSRFDIATGEVLSGPATRGLTTLGVAVDGDTLTITS